eukprot:358302-Chlamydomonas_euryale.AAC.3
MRQRACGCAARGGLARLTDDAAATGAAAAAAAVAAVAAAAAAAANAAANAGTHPCCCCSRCGLGLENDQSAFRVAPPIPQTVLRSQWGCATTT